MGFVECVADLGKDIVCEVSVRIILKQTVTGSLPGGYQIHGVLLNSSRSFYYYYEMFDLPVMFSRSTFSMTAPKSTSEEGTEMDWMEIV